MAWSKFSAVMGYLKLSCLGDVRHSYLIGQNHASQEETRLPSLRDLPITQLPRAINRQHDSRDEACLVAAKEDGRIGAILRLARTWAERLLRLQEHLDRGI